MSQTISPATGKPYGVQRVCHAWEQARSSFYDQHQRLQSPATAPAPNKRGPKPAVSDEALLELIRADLAASPFHGEGHRPVWRRLRYRQRIRVGRMGLLRLMREHNLLSPYRGRRNPPRTHDGTIITTAPNDMWGTDGAMIYTLENGWVWAFIAVEHWNAECVGWHVTKTGDRFAALEPISQGLSTVCGSVAKAVARGLALRMDHGPQYTSDHFVNQIRYWGMADSFAFVSEPQTNGVAERFIRTLKEQAIYGRTFRTLEQVRQAVAEFVELYNALWLLGKNHGRSPREMRQGWIAAQQLEAAA
jgi:transposase InsO family protein